MYSLKELLDKEIKHLKHALLPLMDIKNEVFLTIARKVETDLSTTSSSTENKHPQSHTYAFPPYK